MPSGHTMEYDSTIERNEALTHHNMDEPGQQHAKWKNPVAEGRMCVKCQEQEIHRDRR